MTNYGVIVLIYTAYFGGHNNNCEWNAIIIFMCYPSWSWRGYCRTQGSDWKILIPMNVVDLHCLINVWLLYPSTNIFIVIRFFFCVRILRFMEWLIFFHERLICVSNNSIRPPSIGINSLYHHWTNVIENVISLTSIIRQWQKEKGNATNLNIGS